ncbi:MAG: type II secretion system protein GspC [Minicystis sp.]
MGFDAIFKRYFAAVVCLLIGVAAYFQASGLGQLVVAGVALDPSATPVVPAGLGPVVRHAGPAATEHATGAEAIIGRNPFDSVTGPLDAKPIETTPVPPTVEDLDRDPYEDPFCDTAKAMMIVASDDPLWSFASLAGPDGKTQLRRKGDEINGQTVFFVGDLRPDERRLSDRRDLWDRVWLSSGSTRCQLAVGGKAPVNKAGATKSEPKEDKPKGGKSKVPADIAAKIHKVSENEFNVERSALDSILDNQADLMRSARIVPEKEGDKVVGIRLFGVRSDSLLGMLGLENSDRLSSINGFEMTDPQKALEAYAKLRSADHLTVSLNRRGKPMNIDFNIK